MTVMCDVCLRFLCVDRTRTIRESRVPTSVNGNEPVVQIVPCLSHDTIALIKIIRCRIFEHERNLLEYCFHQACVTTLTTTYGYISVYQCSQLSIFRYLDNTKFFTCRRHILKNIHIREENYYIYCKWYLRRGFLSMHN